MINWYLNSWSKVVELLESDSDDGLGEEEITNRREKWGENKITIMFEETIIKSYFRYFKNLWLILPMILSIYGIYIGKYISSIIILVIPIGMLYLKINRFEKKKKEIKALTTISYGQAKVVRNGFERRINSEELVLGDVVDIRPGTIVPADIRIISSENLKVNEKSLTGEDFISDKYESKLDQQVSNLGEIKNILFKGTAVVSGKGKGIIVATGNYTQLGKVMNMLSSTNIRKETIDEKAENYWNKAMGYSFLIAAIFVSLGVLFKGIDIEFIYSIFLSALSFGGIIVFIIFLKYIKKVALKNKIEILNPSWFDLIKDIDVLFVDKIGSISKNEMQVVKIYTNEEISNIEEVSKDNINFNRMLEIGLIANNSTYNVSEDKGIGDIREVALLKVAAIKHIYKGNIDARNKRLFDIPMDFNKRTYTTVNKLDKGYRANVRGNVDELLDYCTSMMKDGVEVELIKEDKELIREKDYELSKDGLVTIGIAYRNFNYEPSSSENLESNLVFVGIIALENPIIDGVSELLNKLRNEKILPILVTEDNKISATTVAKQVGIIEDDDGVISGIELLNASKEEKFDVLSKTRVFSKIAPELKNYIFTIFKEDNYKISSTGEEIIDLPLLTLSNLAIAKGKASSLVKKVADLYIKENCLEKILYLKGLSEKIYLSINKGIDLYWIFISAEVISITLCYGLFGKQLINDFSILIINVCILPVIVLNSMIKNQVNKIAKRTKIIKILILAIVTVMSCLISVNINHYSIITTIVFVVISFFFSLDIKFPNKKIFTKK